MTTSTEKLMELIDDEALEDRLRDAEDAPEPYADGEEAGQVVAQPSEGGAVQGFVLEQETTMGWKWIWHTRTYERSKCLTPMLPHKLAERFQEGDDGYVAGSKNYVFTTQQPRDADGNALYPVRGSSLCILHAEHPDHEFHASLGLPTCRKSNLRNAQQVRLHAMHRHSQEWAAIQEEREREIREEESLFRRTVIGNTPQPVPVSDRVAVAVEEDAEEREDKPDTLFSFPCKNGCGEMLQSKATGKHFKQMHHNKECPEV